MSLLTASAYIECVDLIDLDALKAYGYRFLLMDRDNTCMPLNTFTIPPAIERWFAKAQAMGFETCLVSNNIFGDSVKASADKLNSSAIYAAMKPSPFALLNAMRERDYTKDETVLVGDQVYTDVVAGNLAGIATILVKPQSDTDLFYTKVLRKLEVPVLKDHRYRKGPHR